MFAMHREDHPLDHAIQLDEMVDRMGLVTIHPAGERGEEELETEDVVHDDAIVPVGRKVVSQGATVRSTFRTLRAASARHFS